MKKVGKIISCIGIGAILACLVTGDILVKNIMDLLMKV